MPALGSLLELQGDRVAVLQRASRELGPIVRLRAGPMTLHMVADPDLLSEALVAKYDRFTKTTRAYHMLKDGLGEGLLTADGPHWAHQRKQLAPAFKTHRIAPLAAVIARHASRLVDRWAQRTEAFDIVPELNQLALGISGEAFLGTDLDADSGGLSRSFDRALALTTQRVLSPFTLPFWMPSPRNLALRRHLAHLDRAIAATLDARRATGDLGDDILGQLLRATDPEGRPLSAKVLRDEVMTLFLAGFETVSTALAWTLQELAHQPTWQARVADEARAVAELDPTEARTRLPVTRRVFLESLRMTPPIWAAGRVAQADETLGPYRIERGEWLLASPIVTHHLEEHWPEPSRWDPDRFLPEVAATRHKHAFLAFLIGPRRCIGEHFAMMEGVLTLAEVLRNFELQPAGPRAPGRPVITLRPAAPIRVSLRRR